MFSPSRLLFVIRHDTTSSSVFGAPVFACESFVSYEYALEALSFPWSLDAPLGDASPDTLRVSGLSILSPLSFTSPPSPFVLSSAFPLSFASLLLLACTPLHPLMDLRCDPCCDHAHEWSN